MLKTKKTNHYFKVCKWRSERITCRQVDLLFKESFSTRYKENKYSETKQNTNSHTNETNALTPIQISELQTAKHNSQNKRKKTKATRKINNLQTEKMNIIIFFLISN